jgi:hypothetical protein
MDLPSRDFTKTAVLGPVAIGTRGCFPRPWMTLLPLGRETTAHHSQFGRTLIRDNWGTDPAPVTRRAMT